MSQKQAPYPRECAPRIGIVFNAIGAFSEDGKSTTEKSFQVYFDALQKAGRIADDSIIITERTFGPHEAARAAEKFAQARVDAVVWVASAFTNGNAFSTLATDRYLWRVPMLLVGDNEAVFENNAEWTTNAWCGVIMNNFAAKRIGRKIRTLPGGPGAQEFEEGFLKFLSVSRTISAMRRDYMIRFGDAPSGFHSATVDELRLTYVFGTRIDRIDIANLLTTYRTGTANGLAGTESFTDEDVAATAARILKMGPVLVDEEILTSGARLYHAFRAMVSACGATSIAVKCWPELQSEHIYPQTPCLAMGMLLGDRIVNAAACESDIPTSVAQSIGALVSGAPAACLDFVNVIRASEILQLGHCGVGISGMMAPNDESAPCGMVDPSMKERIYTGQVKVNCAICRSSPAIQGGSDSGPNLVGQLAYGPKTGIGLVQDGDGFKMLMFAGESTPETAKGMLYSASDLKGVDNKKLHEVIIEEGFSHHLAVAFGDIREELEILTDLLDVKLVSI